MQAMILAAGMGRRLGKITENKTKGMVEVNGRTLLERSLDILTSFDEITRIVLVVGYAAEGVREKIGTSFNGVEVIYVENADYSETNNIYSLYLAKKEFCEDDTILLESDLIFERSLIEKLVNCKEDKNLVLVASWKSWMDGTVVTISPEKKLVQFIGKQSFDYEKTDEYYKTVNIYKFSKEFADKTYSPFLEAYCKAFGHNEYYEDILGIITFINKSDLTAAVIDDHEKWYEIDDYNDLDIAETLFSHDPDTYLKRYGGFWRFPFLKDFCYLVNPYFPPPKMLKEFNILFNRLIAEYPSTSRIQKKLAANIFDCRPEQILVGNGASELINALFSVVEYEKIGLPLPTFHEYIARTDETKHVFLKPDNNNFSYNAKDIIELGKRSDMVALVNPDNPSGNFIPSSELFEILDDFKVNNKLIIIDESFVDFAQKGVDHSLTSSAILDKYPNLIVIRSIGKSYGVPGCRLGILAGSDTNLIQKIQETMPVWNISSFGEFFLQIFHRFDKDYKISLDKIISQREYLFEELEKVPFLRPIQSAANYILCEVLKPHNSSELSKLAIKKGMLIKDCSDKKGFENTSFIRVTVRDQKDNDYFINFIKNI